MTLTITPDDTARTRRSDPLSSHAAGDRSQATIRDVKDAVLVLLMQEEELSGIELNELFELRVARGMFKPAAWDSPRKRAGELAADGLLIVTNADDKRGVPHIYRIPKEQDA